MEGLTSLAKIYMGVAPAVGGLIAASILGSYSGCWSWRSGFCFCWVPLVRTRCTACRPCNLWAVSAGLGTLIGILGLFVWPFIFGWKALGINWAKGTILLPELTDAAADDVIFSPWILGESYCVSNHQATVFK
jgi:hypothetical protein